MYYYMMIYAVVFQQVTPAQLNEFVKSILEVYHDRSMYLDCLKEPVQRPSSATLQGNPALGEKYRGSAI